MISFLHILRNRFLASNITNTFSISKKESELAERDKNKAGEKKVSILESSSENADPALE